MLLHEKRWPGYIQHLGKLGLWEWPKCANKNAKKKWSFFYKKNTGSLLENPCSKCQIFLSYHIPFCKTFQNFGGKAYRESRQLTLRLSHTLVWFESTPGRCGAVASDLSTLFCSSMWCHPQQACGADRMELKQTGVRGRWATHGRGGGWKPGHQSGPLCLTQTLPLCSFAQPQVCFPTLAPHTDMLTRRSLTFSFFSSPSLLHTHTPDLSIITLKAIVHVCAQRQSGFSQEICVLKSFYALLKACFIRCWPHRSICCSLW